MSIKQRFTFKLGQTARITVSGEQGQIVGRAEYSTSEPSYLIRYPSVEGVAVERWWTQSAIELVSVNPLL